MVSNEPAAKVWLGFPIVLGTFGTLPDYEIDPPSHKTKINLLNGDKKELEGYYDYEIEYVKPGKYPLKLASITGSARKFVELKGCVDIKPGAINYLGDFVWVTGKEKDISLFNTWVLNKKTFEANVFFADKQSDAKKFMAKYYPQYKAPFVYAPLSLKDCPKEDK
jgi:hypothetical protein